MPTAVAGSGKHSTADAARTTRPDAVDPNTGELADSPVSATAVTKTAAQVAPTHAVNRGRVIAAGEPLAGATSTAAAAASNPIAGFLHAVASLFGLDRPKAPSDPISAAVWGLFQQVASVFGVTPKVGTPGVSDPVATTGLVTGMLGFTDPDGQALTYIIAKDPTLGVVTVDTAGTYSYTPTLAARLAAAGGKGPTTDTFTVTAFNGTASTRVTVSVPISPDAPVAGAPTVGTPHAVTGVVTGGVTVSDPAGQPLTYSVTGNPSKGTITEFDSSTGKFTYTPKMPAQLAAETAGAVGADTFVISASNGAASTAVTVTVAVDPGTPQIGTPGYSLDSSDPAGVVTGTVTFSDPAGGHLTYSVTSDPTKGTITEFDTSTGEFVYMPGPDSADVGDTFAVTATNGVHSATQTISVPVKNTDPLDGIWTVTSTEGQVDGSEPTGPQPVPDGLQITLGFTRTGSEYNGVLTSTYGDTTGTVPWGTVSKAGPGSYTGEVPADQLAASEQAIRDLYSHDGASVTDVVMSVTFAVWVSDDGKTISAKQSTSQQFTVTGIGDDGESYSQTLDFSSVQTYNGTKISDSVSL